MVSALSAPGTASPLQTSLPSFLAAIGPSLLPQNHRLHHPLLPLGQGDPAGAAGMKKEWSIGEQSIPSPTDLCTSLQAIPAASHPLEPMAGVMPPPPRKSTIQLGKTISGRQQSETPRGWQRQDSSGSSFPSSLQRDARRRLEKPGGTPRLSPQCLLRCYFLYKQPISSSVLYLYRPAQHAGPGSSPPPASDTLREVLQHKDVLFVSLPTPDRRLKGLETQGSCVVLPRWELLISFVCQILPACAGSWEPPFWVGAGQFASSG